MTRWTLPHALVGALLLPWSAATAAAHDFWILPETFRPPPGADLALRLAVGEHCEGESLERNPDRIESFRVVSISGTTDVLGEPGAEPAGHATIAGGLSEIAYRGRRSRLELPAAAFEAYLASEANDDVVAWRASNGESSRPGREAYSRCVKSLVSAGGTPGVMPAPHGWPLELMLDGRSDAWTAQAPLTVRLLSAGDPLANRTVVAISCDRDAPAVTGLTGDDGSVALILPFPGVWLLKSVRVQRAPADVATSMDVEWESHWASLTLQIDPAGDVPGR